MKSENRTDRILILVALLIFLMASGLFYFDDWIWGARHARGERIGNLTVKSGDVRMKFEGELKWQKAAQGQDLVYNDSIYAGSGSNAKLQLGESDMTVTENTLVVLRREANVSFMNLSYGNLFGNIAKNERVVIDTGDGKPIELLTTSKTSFLVKKTGGRTELEVTSGEADLTVNGKRSHVEKSSRFVVDEKKQSSVEKISLQILKPLRTQTTYADQPTRVDFSWAWSSGRKPIPSESYKLEFSSSPDFANLISKREVVGQLTAAVPVSENTSVYYRIRGPKGELSAPEKFNFVRTQKPIIIKPVAQAQFEVPADTKAMVELEFGRPENSSVWYQIAGDAEFKSIITNENIKELKRVRELPQGQYFLRAKGDYGSGQTTAWTDPVPFRVDRRLDVLPLAPVPDLVKVTIPNRPYPAALYATDGATVKSYLARQGLLKTFFPLQKDSFDQLELNFDGGEKMVQADPAWPESKLRPGRYIYKYQTTKKGWQPSPWSSNKRLEITMEPPRPVGTPEYGAVDADGATQTKWGFTPLLFAKSYDLELSHDPGMHQPTELKVDTNFAQAKLKGENYWRVRARDARGRIISEYSTVNKLKAQVPVFLAKNEEVRKPAATERVTTRVERHNEEVFEKNGWWAWVGGGENYVDYRQSIPGRGTLSDHRLKGPSEYVETGYSGHSGFGGAVSFKHTPGEVNPDNAPIDTSKYSWTTLAVEGLYRKTSGLTLFDSPIIYGLRAGVQQHRLPFVVLDSDANLLLKANTMTNASLGALAEWYRNRWTYYWMMRYQYPLASKTDGSSQFDISPVFSFDGSVGTSYNLTRQLKLGLFWYGQWHQFNFVYSDGQIVNNGFQSMFYSNVDLRLGFDF